MSLSLEKSNLQLAIQNAFTKFLNAASNPAATSDDVNPVNLIANLSIDLTEAIHSYTTKADVNLSGILTKTTAVVAVTTPGGPGNTVGPVICDTYDGKGKLE